MGWVGKLFDQSLLVGFFTGQQTEAPRNTCWQALFARLRQLQGFFWQKLHLHRLLRGSIFLKTGFWCALPLVFAPLLPTMVVLALVMAGYGSLFLTMGCRDALHIPYSPVNKWVALYGAIYVFATCTSVSLSGSLFVGMISVCFLLFYFVVITSIRSWSSLRRLMLLLVLVSLPVVLYGFWQYLHPDNYISTWVDTDMFTSITFRVYSTLANPNVLGTYFLLVIPFAVAFFLTSPGIVKKLFFALLCGLLLLCLIVTYSRGCYLGLLLAAAVFLVLLDRRFLLLGVVLLLFSPLYLPETILTRFTSIGNMADSSTSYRVYIWYGTLRMLKDYWFCGIGPGQTAFNMVYPLYAYSAVTAPHAHNLFLQIACDTGVVGLGVFLTMLLSTVRSLFTALKRTVHREARIFQIAALSALAGYLLESMTDYTFYNYRVMLLFWGFMAINTLLTHADRLIQADLCGQTPWDEDAAGQPRRIRVLNIISDTNIGGAGRTLMNYLRYYDRQHFAVTTLVPRGSALKPELEKLGGRVIEADIQGDRSLDPLAIPTLRAMVAAAAPDVVHTHGSMSGRIAARGSHAKLIYSRHSAFPVSASLRHGPGHWANRLLNRLYADGIIAVSPATRENLLDSGVCAASIDIVMNGVQAVQPVAPEVQQAWRTRLGLQPGDFVVGILARLEEYKGHLLLLEAAAALKASGYPIKVLIAGAGDYEATIAARLHALQLEDCVQMLGFTTQVAEFLSVLDVQVNCSYGTEATSLSLLEGFSLGLPAVVSSYGGNPWLVTHGSNGLIFENRNTEALTACLQQLMDQPEQLQRMRTQAQQVYQQRFTGQIFARNIEAVYQKVLQAEQPLLPEQ